MLRAIERSERSPGSVPWHRRRRPAGIPAEAVGSSRLGVLGLHLSSAAPDGFDVAESAEVLFQPGGDREQIGVVARCDTTLAVAQSAAGGGVGGGAGQRLRDGE